MALLAAVPSLSVVAVVARAASFGFIHGAFTAFGVVVGDIILILLAIFGLVHTGDPPALLGRPS